MASESDILIAIKTTADTAGAEEAVSAIKKVETEDMTLQQQREARIKGVGYDKAIYVDPDLEERAARRAANAATIAAAEQEAAEIRVQRAAAASAIASAEKAAAEEKAAIKIEAALAKEAAAAEAQALADEAIANKKITNAAIRALTPRNRQLSAAMSVGNSPAAMAALINPATIALASVVTLGVVSSEVFGKISSEMEAATAAGSKFEEQNIKTGFALRALGSPLKTAMDGWKVMGDAVTGLVDKLGKYITGNSQLVKMKQMADDAEMVNSKKEAYDKTIEANDALTKKLLANQIAVQAAQDNLAKGREQRSGMDSGESAANEISREVNRHEQEATQIQAAIAEAYNTERIARRKLWDHSIERSEEEIADLAKTADDAKKKIETLTNEIPQKDRIFAINLTNKIEGAQKDIQKDLEATLTDNAKALQEDLQGIVDSKGAAASPITRQSLDQINAVLADDKVTADEAGKLEQAAKLFRTSADSKAIEQQKWIVDLMDADKKAVQTAKTLDDQITNAAQNSVKVAATVQATAEAQQTHHVETVAAIGTLAPKASDAQAVVKAVQDVGTAFDAQGAAVISALTALAGKVAAMQSAIQQLAIRNR